MNREPLTIRMLRVLFQAKTPLTRAQLLRRAKVDPATEITRPLRDLRKRHATWEREAGVGRLRVPCTLDAAGRPAYWLTEADRAAAPAILEIVAAKKEAKAA